MPEGSRNDSHSPLPENVRDAGMEDAGRGTRPPSGEQGIACRRVAASHPAAARALPEINLLLSIFSEWKLFKYIPVFSVMLQQKETVNFK